MNSIDDILVLLHEKLSAISGYWAVIGTSSLYLSGYPVKPNDIDILTDRATVHQIEAALDPYRVETLVKPNEKFRSVFSQYNFHGFAIEVMGDLEVNTPGGWVLLRDRIRKPQQIAFKDKTFIVPSKQDQIAIYNLFGRDKDVPVLEMLSS